MGSPGKDERPGGAFVGDEARRTPRDVLTFLALVVVLAVPIWLVGARRLPFGRMDLPYSAVQFVVPLIAASFLVLRREGRRAAIRFLKRAFDHRRVRRRRWYVPTVLLPVVVMGLTYLLIVRLEGPEPTPNVSPLTIPVLFLVYFVTGAAEEIGWMGYAVDPLQRRWGALAAALIVGAVWALWHVVPWLQGGNSGAWVAAQASRSLALRVIIVWLYNNAGRSVFVATLFHAVDNVAVALLFPRYRSPLAPAISGALFAAVAAAVTWAWGPRTSVRSRETRLVRHNDW